ncbi:hypothetical protein QWA68_016867, partial [Fusarium oxysporum]
AGPPCDTTPIPGCSVLGLPNLAPAMEYAATLFRTLLESLSAVQQLELKGNHLVSAPVLDPAILYIPRKPVVLELICK